MSTPKPSLLLALPPLLLVALGIGLYWVVDQQAKPPVQTLTIEPVGPTPSPQAPETETATPSASPQSSSSAQ